MHICFSKERFCFKAHPKNWQKHPSCVRNTWDAISFSGEKILIEQKNKNPRRLTPREACRLQGFPESFKIVVSDNQAYKQFGNSVPTKMIGAVADEILKTLRSKYEE